MSKVRAEKVPSKKARGKSAKSAASQPTDPFPRSPTTRLNTAAVRDGQPSLTPTSKKPTSCGSLRSNKFKDWSFADVAWIFKQPPTLSLFKLLPNPNRLGWCGMTFLLERQRPMSWQMTSYKRSQLHLFPSILRVPNSFNSMGDISFPNASSTFWGNHSFAFTNNSLNNWYGTVKRSRNVFPSRLFKSSTWSRCKNFHQQLSQ